MKNLKGKRFVVAGSATGIGAATAARLAEEGAHIIAGDINKTGLESTVAKISAAGGIVKAVEFDLTNRDSCTALIQACVDTYGGIDGLANVGADQTSATLSADLDLLEMSEEIWFRSWNTNTLGHARTIRAALPYFVAQRNGSIVCVSTGGTHIGEVIRPAYATSKIGLHTLVRHVARRWGPDNIRCNAIAPGPVATETFTRVMSKDDPNGMQRMLESIPLQRPGRPEDLAGPIAFMLSDDATWVTGQVWHVNGGWIMRE